MNLKTLEFKLTTKDLTSIEIQVGGNPKNLIKYKRYYKNNEKHFNI